MVEDEIVMTPFYDVIKGTDWLWLVQLHPNSEERNASPLFYKHASQV